MKNDPREKGGGRMKDFLTPSLIWDLALAALILYVMIRSIGRGFVSSFIHLLGLAAACIVAALLSGKAAAWLYDGYLAERLQTAVSDTLRQKLATFVELLDRIDPTDTISAAAGDALRTVMVAFLTMVAFLIIFLLAMLIVRALAKLTRNVNRVPVVGGVNRVLAERRLILCDYGSDGADYHKRKPLGLAEYCRSTAEHLAELVCAVQISCVNPARERA